jgi:hypothetical protein
VYSAYLVQIIRQGYSDIKSNKPTSPKTKTPTKFNSGVGSEKPACLKMSNSALLKRKNGHQTSEVGRCVKGIALILYLNILTTLQMEMIHSSKMFVTTYVATHKTTIHILTTMNTSVSHITPTDSLTSVYS